VLDVLVTDLMNRDDAIKLPTLLEIAKIPNHPHREEASTDSANLPRRRLRHGLGEVGCEVEGILEETSCGNAASDSPTPLQPAK